MSWCKNICIKNVIPISMDRPSAGVLCCDDESTSVQPPYLERWNSCHVYAIQESNSINQAHLKYFGAGMDDIEKNAAKMQLEGLLDTLTDAKEYGSILNVETTGFAASVCGSGRYRRSISMDSVGGRYRRAAEPTHWYRWDDGTEVLGYLHESALCWNQQIDKRVNAFLKDNYVGQQSWPIRCFYWTLQGNDRCQWISSNDNTTFLDVPSNIWEIAQEDASDGYS